MISLFFRIVLVIIFILSTSSNACTAFLLKKNGRNIMGKNYDWRFEDGILLENKRGVVKSAFGVQKPVKWISKYGSITFNQYGHDIPSSGMNEKGLAIEVLMYDASYPKGDSLPAIDNGQWVQYQLDVSSSIEELISNNKAIKISPLTSVQLHYFASDSKGRSCIIEFYKNEAQYYLSDSVNLPVLTNGYYPEDISLLSKYKAFGGKLEIPNGPISLERFIRTASLLKQSDKQCDDPIKYAESILKSAAQRDTKWTIIYDLDSLLIRFKTSSNGSLKMVNLNSFNFSCDTPKHYFNLISDSAGDISSLLQVYNNDVNRYLIEKIFNNKSFTKELPQNIIEEFINYPEKLKCDK